LIPVRNLPALNAALNAASALFLLTGYVLIRRRNVAGHRLCMLAAVAASGLFLVSYLIYHYHVGSVAFQGRGWARAVYFTILISHTILAAAIVPLVLVTLTRALKGSYEKHRAIARWTFPLWVYVSITGIVVYWMLYHLYRPLP
jgi:uncharacterized membrane protein YozB (DUF420 family)